MARWIGVLWLCVAWLGPCVRLASAATARLPSPCPRLPAVDSPHPANDHRRGGRLESSTRGDSMRLPFIQSGAVNLFLR